MDDPPILPIEPVQRYGFFPSFVRVRHEEFRAFLLETSNSWSQINCANGYRARRRAIGKLRSRRFEHGPKASVLVVKVGIQDDDSRGHSVALISYQ